MPFPSLVRRVLFCLGLLLLPAAAAGAQRPEAAVPVVLLADVHFDPFTNATVLAKLRAAPIEGWPAILNADTGLVADAERTALQEECGVRAPDTAWPLLQRAFTAAREATPKPVFVTLAGDLLVHEFPCRFRKLAPAVTPEELAAFAAKTVEFVSAQLRQAFPRVPVYVALGNNDSGCEDYRETPGSGFLQGVAGALTSRGHGEVSAPVSPFGDYSIPLPAPLRHGRLVVLDDIFGSRLYSSCAGAPNGEAEATQLAWLRGALTAARAAHEQVWVMGHIPPGVDVYTSFRSSLFHPAALCEVKPSTYLRDDSLGETLLDFADVVRLALFAHTHMDEFRVLQRPASAGSPAATIPMKLVPSVSPYAGNHPALLLASVSPGTLVLKDWETIISPGAGGSSPPWTTGYRFTTAFHLPDFGAASARKLAGELESDRTGRGAAATAFREHFYPGDVGLYALGLAQIWPAVGCAIGEQELPAFHDCVCAAAPLTAKDGAAVIR